MEQLTLTCIKKTGYDAIDITSYVELREKYKNLPAKISDSKELAIVSNFLIDISAETKLLDKFRLEATLEPRKITNEINGAFEPYIVEMKEMAGFIKDRILTYNREQELIARQAQERLDAERKAEIERLEKERQKEIKEAVFPDEVPEVVLPEAPKIIPIVGTINTDSGSLSNKSIVSQAKIKDAIDAGVREIVGVRIYHVWLFEIIDASQVPPEYREDMLSARRK